MSYCFDTNTLLDAGERYYPIDSFPTLWEKFEELIAANRLIAPEVVLTELTAKSDWTAQWAKDHSGIFLPITPDIQTQVTDILTAHPTLVDPERHRSEADPFIIAMAAVKGFAVVTSERRRAGAVGRLKIPDVCDALQVRCVTLLDVFRTEGWTF